MPAGNGHMYMHVRTYVCMYMCVLLVPNCMKNFGSENSTSFREISFNASSARQHHMHVTATCMYSPHAHTHECTYMYSPHAHTCMYSPHACTHHMHAHTHMHAHACIHHMHTCMHMHVITTCTHMHTHACTHHWP